MATMDYEQAIEQRLSQLQLWAATDVTRARGLAESLTLGLGEPRPGAVADIAAEIVRLLAPPPELYE